MRLGVANLEGGREESVSGGVAEEWGLLTRAGKDGGIASNTRWLFEKLLDRRMIRNKPWTRLEIIMIDLKCCHCR